MSVIIGLNKMSEYYVINADGSYDETQVKFSNFQSNSVYIAVDIIKKRLYIWKGLECPVRLKFISARAAQELRNAKYSFAYKVDSIDQGDEHPDFLSFVGGDSTTQDSSSSQTVTKPVASSTPIPTARPRQSNVSTLPTSRPAAQPSVRPSSSVATARSRPTTEDRETQPSAPSPSPTHIPSPTPSHAPSSQTSSVPQHGSHSPSIAQPTPTPTPISSQDSVKETLEILKELDIPEGMEREIVIIGTNVFSASNEFHKLFKKEVLRLDPMDDLPDGGFPASDYYTRLYIEKGHVKFIELFSEIPASEREEFLSDMRSSLRDLTKLGV